MDIRVKQGERRVGLESDPFFLAHNSMGFEFKDSRDRVGVSESRRLPLAKAQRGMWMGEKIAPAGALYNLAEYCEILGDVNSALLIAAGYQLTEEAETCRVQILDSDQGPVQQVLPHYPGELPFLDFSIHSDAEIRALQWMEADVRQRLDLASDPLWLIALLKISDRRYFLYQRCHHINLDGFGAGVLMRRLAELYHAKLAGVEPAEHGFHSLDQQLADEAKYRESSRYERDKAYWLEAMAGLPEPLSLARGGTRIGGLRRSSLELSLDSSARLRELASSHSGSLSQLMISLLATYIYRMSGAADLVFGMPVSARMNRQQRSTPCMMANAIAVRLAMQPELTMPELLANVARSVSHGLRHQQYRYEELRRDLGLLGQGQQLSWVGINIEPFDYDLRFGEAPVRSTNLSNGTVEDLTGFVYDRGEHQPLRIDLDANPGLYSQPELDEHAERLHRLIEFVLSEPECRLGDIDLLTPAARQQLLLDWNDTARPLPETYVLALFEQKVASCPDALACCDAVQSLTYRELDTQASKLASALQAQGVGRGDIVAVGVQRGVAMLCTLLAVQKSGAAYLPLDPEAPVERIAVILAEAQPVLFMGDSETRTLFDALAGQGLRFLNIEHESTNAAEFKPVDIQPDDPVYVIFTSGSTGRPKGVVISHHNLLNFMLAMDELLQLSEESRVLAVTTVAFDIATLELYLPLISGAASIIADRETARDAKALIDFIVQQQVDTVQATPSHWQMLLMENAKALHGIRALVGGEAVPAALAKKLRDLGSAPINLYGPTETTVWSSAMVLDGDDLESPPIGRPIWNTQLYILDEAQKPVPLGAVGELYIGGDGVAQGYLHRPELSAERFLDNPFHPGRMYRTGDLVRWREDGAMEYLGRNDFQIKIRGFRVEVGDIEAAMIDWPGVENAAVVLQEAPGGNKHLIAYALVPSGIDSLETAALRQRLQARLPDYMVPAKIIALAHFPTNVNGKLDRKALPTPEWNERREHLAPRNELERTLVSIWEDVLEISDIGVEDSFFDLGGDSIKASLMISRLRGALQREVPLAALFEATTIAELARGLQQGIERDVFAPLLKFKSGKRVAPLFCFHPVLGLGWAFAGLGAHLDEKQGIYSLQATGLDGQGELPASIEEMAADYIARIKQVQSTGPYRLLGWSLGGNVAHEVARQLEEQGEKIAFLSMLDAYPHVIPGAGGQELPESRAVLGALDFLGIDRSGLSDIPQNMAELTAFLCRVYDVENLPIVAEMQCGVSGSARSVVDNVRRVIENNLVLLRNFVPGVIDADIMFVQAGGSAEVDMAGMLQHEPAAWCAHARSVEVFTVASRHQDMLDPDALQELGPLLRHGLERADRMLWRQAGLSRDQLACA